MTETGQKKRHLSFVVGDWEPEDIDLNMADMAVLKALIHCVNNQRNGTEVWPSNAKIARRIRAHPNTVKESKRRLHALGLIKIRRDRGKSDMVTINEELIRSLADPRTKVGGSSSSPPIKVGGYPPTKVGGTPPQNHPRTAKEQQRGNNKELFPLSCSTDLKVQDGPHQRKLAVHGLVAGTTDQLRSPAQEQQTRKKASEAREEALQLTEGLRRAREGPG